MPVSELIAEYGPLALPLLVVFVGAVAAVAWVRK
jgi:hypothetical protein